mmetsp:Transcript_28151/g.71399  ORF Transcript_28151/g.71399 Transcript_28151/m.71399 type:complete len:504 (-) Transcript_28151:134-1645(-)
MFFLVLLAATAPLAPLPLEGPCSSPVNRKSPPRPPPTSTTCCWSPASSNCRTTPSSCSSRGLLTSSRCSNSDIGGRAVGGGVDAPLHAAPALEDPAPPPPPGRGPPLPSRPAEGSTPNMLPVISTFCAFRQLCSCSCKGGATNSRRHCVFGMRSGCTSKPAAPRFESTSHASASLRKSSSLRALLRANCSRPAWDGMRAFATVNLLGKREPDRGNSYLALRASKSSRNSLYLLFTVHFVPLIDENCARYSVCGSRCIVTVTICGAGSCWAGGPIGSVCASGMAAGPGTPCGGSRIGLLVEAVAVPKNAKHAPVALLWFDECELPFKPSSPKKLSASPWSAPPARSPAPSSRSMSSAGCAGPATGSGSTKSMRKKTAAFSASCSRPCTEARIDLGTSRSERCKCPTTRSEEAARPISIFPISSTWNGYGMRMYGAPAAAGVYFYTKVAGGMKMKVDLRSNRKKVTSEDIGDQKGHGQGHIRRHRLTACVIVICFRGWGCAESST